MRGPATLLYGPNAVGGVVNVITPHESYRGSLLDGTRAQFSADVGSANAQAGSNFGLQHARGGVRYWAGGGTRRTDDYATPEGTVENSATESSSVRAGVGWSGDRLFASAGVTANGGRYGVPFAGEFHGHHEGESDGHGGRPRGRAWRDGDRPRLAAPRRALRRRCPGPWQPLHRGGAGQPERRRLAP